MLGSFLEKHFLKNRLNEGLYLDYSTLAIYDFELIADSNCSVHQREMDQKLEPLTLNISDPGGSMRFPSFHVSVHHA